MERISWNEFFMAQSQLLSLRSTCTRLMVGATIVRDKRIIAGGYNGSISGGSHCIDAGCYVVENHCIRTVHAEINALLQCAKFGVATEGAELYVTHFPCVQCAKAIIQSGIQKVFYAEDYKNHPYAIELFQEAEIELIQVELKQGPFGKQSDETRELIIGLIAKLEEAGVREEERLPFIEKMQALFEFHGRESR